MSGVPFFFWLAFYLTSVRLFAPLVAATLAIGLVLGVCLDTARFLRRLAREQAAEHTRAEVLYAPLLDYLDTLERTGEDYDEAGFRLYQRRVLGEDGARRYFALFEQERVAYHARHTSAAPPAGGGGGGYVM